jgi:anti-sigma-K factor RskA
MDDEARNELLIRIDERLTKLLEACEARNASCCARFVALEAKASWWRAAVVAAIAFAAGAGASEASTIRQWLGMIP